MGDITIPHKRWEDVRQNPFFCADNDAVAELEAYLKAIRKAGDSIGAGVAVEATPIPAGLGEPVFDRLDAEIALSLMSINARQRRRDWRGL